jgi:hypothetical protein
VIWEPVHAHRDNTGRLIYWRLVDENGRSVGAYSRHPEGFRAIRYLYRPGRVQNAGREELGVFSTWRAARRAVQRMANPDLETNRS